MRENNQIQSIQTREVRTPVVRKLKLDNGIIIVIRAMPSSNKDISVTFMEKLVVDIYSKGKNGVQKKENRGQLAKLLNILSFGTKPGEHPQPKGKEALNEVAESDQAVNTAVSRANAFLGGTYIQNHYHGSYQLIAEVLDIDTVVDVREELQELCNTLSGPGITPDRKNQVIGIYRQCRTANFHWDDISLWFAFLSKLIELDIVDPEKEDDYNSILQEIEYCIQMTSNMQNRAGDYRTSEEWHQLNHKRKDMTALLAKCYLDRAKYLEISGNPSNALLDYRQTIIYCKESLYLGQRNAEEMRDIADAATQKYDELLKGAEP
jgi:hypothetical protein